MCLRLRFTAIALVVFLSVSLLTVSTQQARAASFEVSLLSGQGGAGEFAEPNGLAVGFEGEVYVADTDNFVIKKIAANGDISVFAKALVTDNGNTDDSFCNVYVRNANEIWASNCINTKVLRFDRNGTLIRTYSVALPFTSNCPICRDWGGGLVVDNLGGIYLSDESNNVILRIDEASGRTTVHAGQPGKTGNSNTDKALLNLPRGLAIDSKNNLYIADLYNGAIRKVTPEGIVTTVQSGLAGPIGVAVDSTESIFDVSE